MKQSVVALGFLLFNFWFEHKQKSSLVSAIT